MPYEAHTPTPLGVVASQLTKGSFDVENGVFYPAVPNDHYPSFMASPIEAAYMGTDPAFGARKPDAVGVKTLAAMAAAEIGKAQSGLDLYQWKPSDAGVMNTHPSNEIGAEIRIAYFYAIASRLLDGAGKKGLSQGMLRRAQESFGLASKWIAARYSPSGQLKDAGKVETAAQIAARFKSALQSVQGVAQQAKVPKLQAVAGALAALANSEEIRGSQVEAGEDPGSPMSTAILAVGGLALVAGIAFAISRR